MKNFVISLIYMFWRISIIQTGSPALRSLIRGSLKGRSPSKSNPFPLSFEGEGDKGGEVDKQSLNPGS